MEPLADRADCLVPQFGSLVRGQYRVLCLYDRPPEDRIVELARTCSPHGPLLALYLGRMTEQRRRDLAEMCWRKHRTFLVIDESLVFFLCGERFKRLPVLFACAFPFTVAEPYTTTSSLVPVEMFYGREREREAVIDRFGSNLVYGGRQLGKTALLRDVEWRYHDAAHGVIVRYIDLTHGESIGVSRPAEDIWVVLGHALAAEKVFSGARTNPRSVAEGVKEWLGQDDKRRIVLLLDEADAFLDSDSRKGTEQTGHTFPNVSGLKGIMDATDRRFKVVFAGLHNVQRTARDPNSPIAHLGAPICIGPLLEQGEWRQARALVEKPLRNLGYRFELDDLPLRILSHTNFYPSLIQIFCKGLLKRLQDPNRTFFDFKACPPYSVTARDVEDAYRSDDVRGEIRHRFGLTLDLDTRYKLIALCIAHASVEQRPERALVEGFDVGWVRDNATYWWAKGFARDSSFEAFRTVLDEMVGLGVLRKTGGDRYALRSSNVLNLLGSKEQIAQALLDVTLTVPPPEYEAATFRRTRRGDPWLRSPLTAQQESELLAREKGVAVLFGSAMSGLDRVIDFLRETCDQSLLRIPERVTEFRTFEAALRDIKADGPEGVFLLVLGPECGWSERWVESAVDYLRRKTSSKKRFLRVLFLGDPQAAWEWGRLEDWQWQKLADAGVRELALHPWREPALRRWMLDAGFGPHDNPEGCREFLRVTGGWDALVLKIGESCRDSPHNWKEHLRALEETWKNDSAWLARFGLVQATLPVLRDLAVWWDAPFSTGDAAEVLERPDDDPTLVQSLAWADRLQYARKVEQGKWRLDDVVRAALQAELAG